MIDYKIDLSKFQVICQKCGQTGLIDCDKSQTENGFFFMFALIDCIEIEYHLCGRCYQEVTGLC